MAIRTSFSMSEEVSRALKKRAKDRGKSVSSTIEELLREGLHIADEPDYKRFVVTPFNLGIRQDLTERQIRDLAFWGRV